MKSLFCALSLTCVLAVPVLFAVDPPPTHLIAYQGVLLGPNGATLAPDGQYNLTFKLYEAATGGTAVWTESQTNVVVKDGFFSVTLGSNSPASGTGALTALDFRKQFYLGITVGKEAELTPRVKLSASPYAANADTVDNEQLSNLMTRRPRADGQQAGYDTDLNGKADDADKVGGFPVGRTTASTGVMLRDDYDTNGDGKADKAFEADVAKGFQLTGPTNLDLNGGIFTAGTLRAGNGTAALPTIGFASDADTGLWWPGANLLAFSANGMEKLRLSATTVTVTGAFSAGAATVASLDAGTGTISGATVNTGQGANELFAMNQNVRNTDAVTFSTVDTGQGPCELYAMSQNVRTTDAVTFASVNTGQGANELYAMNQPVLTTSAVTFGTVNTGQGANELYAMNQAVRTTDNVTFSGVNMGDLRLGIPGAKPTATAKISINIEGTKTLLLNFTEDGDDYFYFEGDFVGTSGTGNILRLYAPFVTPGTPPTPGPAMTWRGDGLVTVPGSMTVGGALTVTGEVQAGAGGANSFYPVPVGAIIAYGGATAPTGWMICNGASVSRTTYPQLFAAIGTAWGAADATHFNLPDLRGQFLRGRDAGATRDPNAATRTASATGGNTGDNVGSVQDDELKSHTHTYNRSNASGTNYDNVENGDDEGLYYKSYDTGAAGGTETRPVNAYVIYIIKGK